MTDNRTNEPTEAQVEAAAATIAVEDLIRWRKTWGDLREGTKQDFRRIARAALVAAQEAAPVTPSSGVDEDALAEVIGSLDWGYMVDGPSVSEIARAVAEWLKGQGR